MKWYLWSPSSCPQQRQCSMNVSNIIFVPISIRCFPSSLNIVKVAQSYLTLCNLMDYTVHGILPARILEWVAFPFSRGSSQTRDWTQVSCIAGGFFTSWTTVDEWRLVKHKGGEEWGQECGGMRADQTKKEGFWRWEAGRRWLGKWGRKNKKEMKGSQKFKREELRVSFQGWLGWNVRQGLGEESRWASKKTGGTGDGYTEEQRNGG